MNLVLILASRSKGRKELLQRSGIEFEVIVSNFDEDKITDRNAKSLVKKLSYKKAEAVVLKILSKSEEFNSNNKVEAVLGCDSLFEFKGEIFGKPRSKEEALNRWRRMSSQSGELHTGHSLMYRNHIGLNDFRNRYFNGIISEVISTKVHFAKLEAPEIAAYVDTDEPMNCAGGFAIEGKGAFFVETIDGCYSNVVGLSLPWLRKALVKASLSFI